MIGRLLFLLPAVALLVSTAQSPVWAHGGCGCSDCGGVEGPCGEGDCGCPTMTRTCYRPEYTTEMRTVTRCEYKTEQRERQVTVYNWVPITEEKTATYTVMRPETRTRTVTY